MKTALRFPVFLGFLVALAVGAINSRNVAAQPGQGKEAAQSRAVDKPSRQSGPPPRAILGAASDEPAPDRIRRQSRELRRRNFYRFISDPGRLVEGEQETFVIRHYDFAGAIDPYPAETASAVLIGTVMSAKGFVSQDRTYVYADYSVRIEEVLSVEQSAKLAVGDNITVSRPGAIVEFPSGHRRHYLIEGQGLPDAGKQYLFFLVREIPDSSEYTIIIGGAYEISNGKGFPLDDYNPRTRGISIASLIANTKQAIVSSRR